PVNFQIKFTQDSKIKEEVKTYFPENLFQIAKISDALIPSTQSQIDFKKEQCRIDKVYYFHVKQYKTSKITTAVVSVLTDKKIELFLDLFVVVKTDENEQILVSLHNNLMEIFEHCYDFDISFGKPFLEFQYSISKK